MQMMGIDSFFRCFVVLKPSTYFTLSSPLAQVVPEISALYHAPISNV